MNKVDLEELERLGGLFMSPEDVALILEVDDIDGFTTLINSTATPEGRAFKKGIAKSKLEFHESEVPMGKSGAPIAAKITLDLMLKQELEMTDG